MISFYFRSSSINTYLLCELKFLIEYGLGFKLPTNSQAAPIGVVIHKGMEILGLRQLAIQDNKIEFYEEELGKTYITNQLTPQMAIEDALCYYVNKTKLLESESIGDVVKYFNKTIDEYPQYTPLANKVKEVEKHFDFELPFEWASYEYKIGKDIYKGQLSLKGTVDLIFDISPDTIEVCDYKSGKTKNDWITGKPKDSENLRDDIQLCLYYYAIRACYPEIKNVLMTLLFIRAGGPISVYFTDEDLPRIEKRLELLFKEIKANKWPKNIKRGPTSFKCSWCSFKTTEYANGVNYCDFFEKELQTIGLDKLTAKYMKLDEAKNYGAGGGATDRKENSV